MAVDAVPDDVALKHAWDWFTLHAAQRMQSLNLLLLGVALLLAGYGVAFQSKNYAVASVICVAGAALAVSFGLLDIRNRQLVRAAEGALKVLQKQLATATKIPQLEFLSIVEKPTFRGASYTNIIRGITVAAFVVFVVGLLVAIAYSTGTGASTPADLPSPHNSP